MNCANHPDVEKVAFCRTCGKALCVHCTRDVRGVIYCENCLADRMAGVQPQQTVYQQVIDQGAGVRVAPSPGSGPNPTVAGILAGFFPFGVGAVYCGQYAKGLAHLGIFVLLILGLGDDRPWYINTALGLALAFFYVYQIIEAVRTARAVQTGQPVPDPFGLGTTFSTGERTDTARIPTAAIVLIGLGLIFLLHNMGFWFFRMDRLWPIILIVIGAWLFARRWGVFGTCDGCSCPQCRARSLMGPAVLITLGVLFLLERQGLTSFGRTWPALLLVIGLVKLLQSNASNSGHVTGLPPAPSGVGPMNVGSGEVQPPTGEVKNG